MPLLEPTPVLEPGVALGEVGAAVSVPVVASVPVSVLVPVLELLPPVFTVVFVLVDEFEVGLVALFDVLLLSGPPVLAPLLSMDVSLCAQAAPLTRSNAPARRRERRVTQASMGRRPAI